MIQNHDQIPYRWRVTSILAFSLGWLLCASALPLTSSAADNAAQANTPLASPNQNATPSSPPNPGASAGNNPPDTALQAEESDPFEKFNSAMFTFNLKVDDYVLHPVASGYAKVIPQGGREAIGRALDNVAVIPRFANNAFQLRIPEAGTEVARFGINTTAGLLGFFDPADKYLGLKEHPDDFGLTLRYYNVPTGPYLMLPLLGPSTVGDTVGRAVDGAMDPLSYFVPWYVSLAARGGQTIVSAVNYRSLHLDMFEQADRYAIDLYGAVQDGYLQQRDNRVKELKHGE
jgi:phospholipid-binding lipoprotein MlaA